MKTKTEKQNKTDNQPQTESKGEKKQGNQKKVKTGKPSSFPVYPWVVLQGNREGVKGDQVLLYHWLFWRNSLAKLEGNVAYGKVSYRELYAQITTELGIGRPDRICSDLQKKGWIRKTHCKPFEGHRTFGFLCMKDKDARKDAIAEQQEMQLEEEKPENTKVMESLHDDKGAEWPGPGVYNQFGTWLYNDANGEAVILPKDGDFPARPSEDAEWWEPEGRWVTLEEYRQLYKEQNKN